MAESKFSDLSRGQGATWERRAQDGILGAPLGDALGVPHEFKQADQLPSLDRIVLGVPAGCPRGHPGVAAGCWSDDGAQLLCLLQTLHDGDGRFDAHAFATELLAWWRQAHHQAGGRIFDCGPITRPALDRLAGGVSPEAAGILRLTVRTCVRHCRP